MIGRSQCPFDPIAGVVTLNRYWSGPNGSGEKYATWRCYSPTEIVALLENAGLHLIGTYRGLSKLPTGRRATRNHRGAGRVMCRKLGQRPIYRQGVLTLATMMRSAQ